MTWGQLRLQLQISAPGVSLDLLDEFLNTRYEQVLEATDWLGLKGHATIQTTAAHQSSTDTVTLTVGSNTVTGSGTGWMAAITGQKFYRPGDTVIYTATYVSGTSATLDRAYEGNGTEATGTVYSGSSYVLMQNVYSLPADCRTVVSILNPVTGQPLTRFSKENLDAAVGARTLVSDPASYAVYDDIPETSPPVLQQVELYPPPLRSRGFTLEYVRSALSFDGGNTSGSPLPFISSSVLLAGCRADIQMHLKDFNAARGYEAAYEEELARLLRVEHQQRRSKTAIGMASRHTRHRLARAIGEARAGWGPGQGGPN